jgi:formate hydrogenlyase transcriptional activator
MLDALLGSGVLDREGKVDNDMQPVQSTDGFDSTEQALRQRLAFECMAADLSARLINLPGERVEPEVERGLQQLVELAGFDRSTLIEFTAHGTAAAVCSAATNGMQPYPCGTFPTTFRWFLSEMRSGRTLILPGLPDDLPADAFAEREFCAQSGYRSHVSVPLRENGRITGFLMLGAFHPTPARPEDLWARLEVLGQVFARALARSRADAKVAAQMGDISQLNERLEAENRQLRQSVRVVQATQVPLAEAERRHIYLVLEKCGWRVRGEAGAASILQIKPTTLEARMKKLGVRRPY